jgi:hypothetical protein
MPKNLSLDFEKHRQNTMYDVNIAKSYVKLRSSFVKHDHLPMATWEIVFLYQNRSATTRLSFELLKGATFLQLSELARPLLSIDLPPDSLFVDLSTSDVSDVSALTGAPVDPDFILECPVLSFVNKADYSEFDSFLNEILPSALSASTSFGEFQESFISVLNTAQAIQESALLPKNSSVLGSQIPDSVFAAGVAALLKWFLCRSFLSEFSGGRCRCQSQRPLSAVAAPKQLTAAEMEKGAFDAEVFECSACGFRDRRVFFLNPAAIIESGRGGPRENCFLFACALAALGVHFRVVMAFRSAQWWCEAWITDSS